MWFLGAYITSKEKRMMKFVISVLVLLVALQLATADTTSTTASSSVAVQAGAPHVTHQRRAYGWYWARVRYHGSATAHNLLRACHQVGGIPPCDHSHYNDGKCIVTPASMRRHLSHPAHSEHISWPGGNPAKMFRYAHFYTGHSYGGSKSLYNTGGTHRWSTAANGWTVCLGRKSMLPNRNRKAFNNRRVNRVRLQAKAFGKYWARVSFVGPAISPNLITACKRVGGEPACDHSNYQDGRCFVADINLSHHLSHPSHVERRNWPPGNAYQMFRNANMYCGHANHQKSLFSVSNTHAWSARNGGDTICVSDKSMVGVYKQRIRRRTPNRVRFQTQAFKYYWARVTFRGMATSTTLRTACARVGGEPPCDHSTYNDGRCKVFPITLGHHLSHPGHSEKRDWPPGNAAKWFRSAFFYCGNANHQKALFNTGGSHRWSNGNDRGGETVCVSKKSMKGVYKRQLKTRRKNRVTRETRAFKKYWARVTFRGPPTSNNLLRACKHVGAEPACDHSNYEDGRCFIADINRSHHLSHPRHSERGTWPKGNAQLMFRHAFFYCGRANHQKSLYNTGSTHVWSTTQRGGVTVCVSDKSMKGVFVRNIRRRKANRVRIQVKAFKRFWARVTFRGQANSGTILRACAKLGAEPACDHSNYQDGKCFVAEINLSHHLSHPSHSEKRNWPPGNAAAMFRSAFMYCGHANHQKALFNNGGSHSWSTANNVGGETICVSKKSMTGKNVKPMRRRKPNRVTYEDQAYGKYWARVTFRGMSHSTVLRNACAHVGAEPACDNSHYNDGRCIVAKINQQHHLSHPGHSEKRSWPGENAARMFRSAFFYCGIANGQKSLFNTGGSHRWSNGNDRGGETVCVANKSMKNVWIRHPRARKANLVRHQVKAFGYYWARVSFRGAPVSDNLLKACSKVGAEPACDHSHYLDGKCIISPINLDHHLSHASHSERRNWPPGNAAQMFRQAYMYCGHANHQKSLFNTGGSHRWSTGANNGGVTICMSKSSMKGSYVQKLVRKNNVVRFQQKAYGYYWARVTFRGSPVSSNLRAACRKVGAKPACNHSSYNDGKCLVFPISSGHHLSYPPHVERRSWPAGNTAFMFRNTFTYCGRANHQKSLLSIGGSHRWSVGSDNGGETICVSKKPMNKFMRHGDAAKRAAMAAKKRRLKAIRLAKYRAARRRARVAWLKAKKRERSVKYWQRKKESATKSHHRAALNKARRRLAARERSLRLWKKRQAAAKALAKRRHAAFLRASKAQNARLAKWKRTSATNTRKWRARIAKWRAKIARWKKIRAQSSGQSRAQEKKSKQAARKLGKHQKVVGYGKGWYAGWKAGFTDARI